MRTIEAKIEQNVVITHQRVRIQSRIFGFVLIGAGADVVLSGTVAGDVVVTAGRLQLSGTVAGDVTNLGGMLDVSGVIHGRLFRDGGTTNVASSAVIGLTSSAAKV